MRPRIRLGILIAIVAALAIGLARVADTWKRGEFDYQRKHAEKAIFWGRRAADLAIQITWLKDHGEHDRSCESCRMRTKPLAETLDGLERERAANQARCDEHAGIAGPAAMRRHTPSVEF